MYGLYNPKQQKLYHASLLKPVLLNFFVATEILSKNRQQSFGDPIFLIDFIASITISIFIPKM